MYLVERYKKLEKNRRKGFGENCKKAPKIAQNGLKWPILGCHVTIFGIFDFSQICQCHEVLDTWKLHCICKNWKNLSTSSTALKDHVILGQMLKKHPIPSVFNPLIENRKRFPIIEFQPFLQEIYISTIERIVSQFFDIAPKKRIFILILDEKMLFKAQNGIIFNY